jgi:hypothetical protein
MGTTIWAYKTVLWHQSPSTGLPVAEAPRYRREGTCSLAANLLVEVVYMEERKQRQGVGLSSAVVMV